MTFLVLVALLCAGFCPVSRAQEAAPEPPKAQAAPSAQSDTGRRTGLNLLGRTDVSSGESRRNENVQFNLIDNNALKELNVRMGTTATIVSEFLADRLPSGHRRRHARSAPGPGLERP